MGSEEVRKAKSIKINPEKHAELYKEYEIFSEHVREKYETDHGKINLEAISAFQLYNTSWDFLKSGANLEKDEIKKIIELFSYLKPLLKSISLDEIINLIKIETEEKWIRTLKDMGLISVFRPRREKKVREELYNVYKRYILSSKEVWMMGISLIDFFGKKAIYRDILETAVKQNIQFRCIILDPSSNSSEFRVKVEQGDDVRWFSSTLVEDIKAVMKEILEPPFPQMDKLKENIRFAQEMPYSYCIICDEVFLIENYHSGNIKKAKGYDGMKPKQDCIGGYAVPYYKFSTNSSYGKVIKDSFQRLYRYWDAYKIDVVRDQLNEKEQKAKEKEKK